MTESSLQPVVDYLNVCGGEDVSTALTPKKIYERGTFLEVDPAGRICFEVERHHRVLGGEYRKGLPMAAYCKYWPQYRFDPIQKTLEQLESKRPAELGEIDYVMLAEDIFQDFSFDLERNETGTINYREQCYGDSGTVSNLDELERVSVELVSGWQLDHLFEELVGLSEETTAQIRKELDDSLACRAVEVAQHAWEDLED